MKGSYLIVFLAFLLLGCIRSENTRDYHFIVSNELWTSAGSELQSILELQSGQHRLITPSSQSNIWIMGKDSIVISSVYNPNWAEKMAGSKPTMLRYRKNVSKLFANTSSKWKRSDSLSIILEQLTNKYIVATSPVNELPQADTLISFDALAENLYNVLSKVDTQMSIVIYLSSIGSLDGSPGLNSSPDLAFDVSEAKKATYNAMRKFYENLEQLYEYQNDELVKRNLIDVLMKSFVDTSALVQIQNKDDSQPTSYRIKEFLNRIASDKRFQYEDVSIFMSNFYFLKDFQPLQNEEIPIGYPGEINFNQGFEASRAGNVVYQDNVNKSVEVIAKREPQLNDGLDQWVYSVYIKSISVNHLVAN